MKNLIEGRGGGALEWLVHLRETTTTSSLGASSVALRICHHGILERAKIQRAETQNVFLVELGLLLLAITLFIAEKAIFLTKHYVSCK